jgi:nucleotide-binding universal stress UspA family protein
MAAAKKLAKKPIRARSRPRPFERILVPLDFTKRDRAVLEKALLVADASGSSVTLFHVVYVPNEASRDELESFYEDLARRARRKLETYAARSARRDVVTEVVTGIPLQEILARARRDGTDLIVLSSHPVEPARPVPGWDTLSYKVAALCRCPVLLAK